MNAAPWTYLGWALLAVLGIGAVVAIIGSVIAFRQARRFERRWQRMERDHRKIEAEIRRGIRPPGGRFKL